MTASVGVESADRPESPDERFLQDILGILAPPGIVMRKPVYPFPVYLVQPPESIRIPLDGCLYDPLFIHRLSVSASYNMETKNWGKRSTNILSVDCGKQGFRDGVWHLCSPPMVGCCNLLSDVSSASRFANFKKSTVNGT